ncbi:MAG: NlpC/P60 family protein [Erythrobacter sp.]
MIGLPFRLHGRDPMQGVDCVGLLYSSLREIGRNPVLPNGYQLRNSSVSHWLSCAEMSGFNRATDAFKPGDVVLVKPAPGQHHLMIAGCSNDVIHAHAGLRRVVSQTMTSDQEFLFQWRLAPE